MIGYYRKFCKNFAQMAIPLTDLLKENVKFVRSDRCQKFFEALKRVLCHYLVLKIPDFTMALLTAVDANDASDASDEAPRVVLLQKSLNNDGIENPRAFVVDNTLD